MNPIRHHRIPDVHNFRDLGGYTTADGKVTKWGILYRCDSLSELTDEGWARLRALGVDLIIDLRGDAEKNRAPVNPAYPLQYCQFPLMGRAAFGPGPQKAGQDTVENKDEEADEEFVKSMELNYEGILFSHLDCACAILDAIRDELASGRGSVAFMCSAGKDRTGITAALLLTLCGVSEEDIVADYMVSANYNRNGINQRMENLPPERRKAMPDPAMLKVCLSSDPKTMRALLDAFRKRDIRRCLSDHGFGAKKQEELKGLMTEGL